jgi:hypothetical protein
MPIAEQTKITKVSSLPSTGTVEGVIDDKTIKGRFIKRTSKDFIIETIGNIPNIPVKIHKEKISIPNMGFEGKIRHFGDEDGNLEESKVTLIKPGKKMKTVGEITISWQ